MKFRITCASLTDNHYFAFGKCLNPSLFPAHIFWQIIRKTGSLALVRQPVLEKDTIFRFKTWVVLFKKKIDAMVGRSSVHPKSVAGPAFTTDK